MLSRVRLLRGSASVFSYLFCLIWLYLSIAVKNAHILKCSLAYTDEQLQLQEVARSFARDEIIPRAAELDRTGEADAMVERVAHLLQYPWDLIKKAHGLGLMNLHVPAAYGML